MKRAMILAGILGVFALGFLWVGSAHPDRCMRAGDSGCSMLPWSGQPSGGYLLHGTTWKVVP